MTGPAKSCPAPLFNSEGTQCSCHIGLSVQRETKNYDQNGCYENEKTSFWLMDGETIKWFLRDGLSNWNLEVERELH